MGTIVGIRVGAAEVGCIDGIAVGAKVGITLGKLLGVSVGL